MPYLIEKNHKDGTWVVEPRYGRLRADGLRFIKGVGKDPNEAMERLLAELQEDNEARVLRRQRQIDEGHRRSDIRLEKCPAEHPRAANSFVCDCDSTRTGPAGYVIHAKCRICGKWEHASNQIPSPLEREEGSHVCGGCDLY